MSIAPATLHLDGAAGMAAPIRRGDTYTHSMPVEDDLGVPINKGAPLTFLAQIRKTKQSTTILATFTVVVSGAFSNIITWSLTATQTKAIPAGSWWWDLQETNGATVITRIEGEAEVDWDVSRIP